MLNTDNYKDTLKRYIHNATEEPNQDVSYITGLEHALTLVNDVETKQDLVVNVMRLGLAELDTPDESYSYVRGIVSALKEALKIEGDLDLEKFTVITPAHQIVKDANNKPIPLKYVQGDYTELWTMPEVLIADMTYVQYAREVV